MDYKIIDYKDASVQMASFEGKEGCGEYHLLAHVPPEGSFQQQLEQLHTALDKAIEDECKGAAPVFIRYFLSDVSNQAEILYKSLEGRGNCAVSVIGQPPLDGSKVSVWTYLVTVWKMSVLKTVCGLLIISDTPIYGLEVPVKRTEIPKCRWPVSWTRMMRF